MIAMKNILIYFDYPITSIQGGTEQASFLLARLLVRQGFRIIFLSLHPFKEKNNEFLQYSLPDSEYLFSRRNADFTEKLCDEQNINFILNEGAASDSSFFFSHAHLNTKATIVSIINFSIWEGLDHFLSLIPPSGNTWLAKLKTVARVVSAPWKKYMAIRKKKTKLNHLLEYSDKVVVLSQKYIQDCLSLTSTRNAHKLYAIPNLLTFQIPESLSSGTKQNILLYVGRLSYADKRVDRLLSVWKKLQPVNTDWSLYIVGDGEYRENLEKISEEYHLKRIFFMGHQNPEPFYKKSKIVCLTSTHEGMPMVVNEALAYGCIPVVFDSFHAAKEMIPNTETGRLVPAFNLKQYTKTLDGLMKERYRRPNFKVLDNYKEEIITRKWLHVLKNGNE